MSAGRPALYKTPETLQERIDKYFDNLGNQLPTISGLAYELGFESRQSMYDYEKKEEFAYTIKRAKLRVEMSYEQSLRKTGRSGDIFALKNFGWTDRQDINIESNSFAEWAKGVASRQSSE